jgi:hypothetical protein
VEFEMFYRLGRYGEETVTKWWVWEESSDVPMAQ